VAVDGCEVDAQKIGGFLVAIGVMQPWHVGDVLIAQERGDDRLFGEIAISRGYIDDWALWRYVDTRAIGAGSR